MTEMRRSARNDGVPYTVEPDRFDSLQNKGMAKELLAYHKIRVPNFAIFSPGATIKKPPHLKFPLFTSPPKKRRLTGSPRIPSSRTTKRLERIHFIHERMNQTALAEEYIEGREIYVSLIGNERLRVFPLREVIFTEVPEDQPKFHVQSQVGRRLSQAVGHPECFRRAVSRRHRPEHRKDLQGCLSRLAHSRLRPHRPAGDSGRRDRHPGSQPESQPGPRR